MPNNSVNKVIYNNNTLIDLTGDTAVASDVASGKTFHLASGEQAVGTGGGSPSNPYVEYTYSYVYALDSYYIDSAVMHGNWTAIPNGIFRGTNISSFDIPSTITIIDSSAFYNCENLTNVVLPSGLVKIKAYAFSGCRNIPSGGQLRIPSSVTTIEAYAFQSAYKYSTGTVRFLGTPSNLLSSYTFNDNMHLTDIYVPWAQGAVAGAPWGATNATIHYKSTV